ncbi:hypothetical protein BaRGS_00008350 [Batillaria attramentaria]|uniref:Uncharacterized protein n=1 Tax=Batillaria attramentaria TaxID=370345 RepID=A0ABD0LMM0_9CAEN
MEKCDVSQFLRRRICWTQYQCNQAPPNTNCWGLPLTLKKVFRVRALLRVPSLWGRMAPPISSRVRHLFQRSSVCFALRLATARQKRTLASATLIVCIQTQD